MIRSHEGGFRLDELFIRIRRRLRALRARTRNWLGLADFDPGEVGLNQGFHHPIDSDQRSFIASQYLAMFPDAALTEVAEARRLAAHRFTFLGHSADYGEPIAWSRDPVSGRDWDRGFSPDIPYRGPGRLGDIKFPWELNKHQYFFTLGKAAWLTGDPAPAVEIVRQIDHWIQDNPCLRGINWIDALPVGMRAVAWIVAYPFYAAHCDRSFRHRLARSLAQHMLFVERHLAIDRFANNHLIGEAAALVAGGLFLDCPKSPRWLEKGVALLEQEMERQVTSDGVHKERSPAYHRFCLDQYYLANALLVRNGRSLSRATCRGMERMTEFLMNALFPDGSAPTFGDGDDARGLWLHADCPAEYRSLLALGAVLFGRGDFKAASGGLKEEILWLLGNEGVTKFQALTTHPPGHTSAAYPEGGYYMMRGGWNAAAPLLMFDCGPLGHGSAGHGHADALSFQLYADGYPFLVDSGTFSYSLDYAWRDAFRSTRAHNTIVVDGQDQSAPGDRMSWKSMAAARVRRWVTTHWFDLVDGEHDGYHRLPDPVTHGRVIVFLKPDTWLIWDRLDGNGRHDLEFLLHLRPDCTVEAGQGGTSLILRSPGGKQLYTRMLDDSNGADAPEIVTGNEEERSAWFSPAYGTRVSTTALRVQREFVGRARLITFLSTSKCVVPALRERDHSLGVSVQRGDCGQESIFYRVQTDWPSGAEGIQFDGQLLYRRQMPGTSPVLWAGGFRVLSVTGLLEARSPVPVESLTLVEGRCEVVLPPEHAANLAISVPEGVYIVVNGCAAPP